MDACGCVWVGEPDYTYFEIFSKMFRAEEEYTCCECNRNINEGEEFELFVGSYEGEISTYITCQTCVEIRNVFFCDGWIFSRVIERLELHIDEVEGNISSECISSLPPKARETFCDMLEKYWEEFCEDDED